MRSSTFPLDQDDKVRLDIEADVPGRDRLPPRYPGHDSRSPLKETYRRWDDEGGQWLQRFVEHGFGGKLE